VGVVRPPSIAGGSPEAYAPGEPSEAYSYCDPSCAALPIILPPVTMRIARYMASGRLRLHAAVELLATVVVGCGYLQGSAYIGNGLSLVEQLLGTAQLADALIGVVAFAFLCSILYHMINRRRYSVI
jgi:hypothetical protein